MNNLWRLLLPVLVVAWTIWGAYDYKKLKLALARGERQALLREYRITVAGELIGGLVAVAAVGTGILSTEASFDLAIDAGARPLVIGGMAGLLLGLVASRLAARKGKKAKLAGDIAALIPRSALEKRWYCAVAISAGVCEELIFRGFGLRLLADLGLTGITAIVAGGVVFGLAHFYQGWKGMLATGAMGFFLGLVFAATGSLIWPIVLHTLMDLRVLALSRQAAGP